MRFLFTPYVDATAKYEANHELLLQSRKLLKYVLILPCKALEFDNYSDFASFSNKYLFIRNLPTWIRSQVIFMNIVTFIYFFIAPKESFDIAWQMLFGVVSAWLLALALRYVLLRPFR